MKSRVKTVKRKVSKAARLQGARALESRHLHNRSTTPQHTAALIEGFLIKHRFTAELLSPRSHVTV